MSELGPRDAWHEELLTIIRERAQKNQRHCGPSTAGTAAVYNWPEVSSRLSSAAAVAVADATIPVDRRHTALRRALILGVRRLIVSLLHFLTARQSEYNLGVLHALRETGKAVRALEQRLTAQDEEIRQLRERISHLEKHLPVEVNRKAS
jgi:hypothetical protein